MHAIKNLNAKEGRVGGYLVVWGSPQRRDLQGEYFTPQTELGLDWYEKRPVLYHHGLDGDLEAAVIGVIDTLKSDEVGVWAEAQLDMRRRYVRTVQRLVDKGVLAWSSGSLPHLVEVANDGQIQRWPIVEGSLTPTPAEPRLTNVGTVKSAYKALGMNFVEPQEQGETDMNENEMTMENSARKRLPVASEREATKSSSITVGSQFDNLDALDLLHGYVLMRATKNFHGVSEQYANALAWKVQKAGISGIKSSELSTSTQAGFGDEWVPDLWSAEIWRKARGENVILPLFRSVEMDRALTW